MANEDQEQPLPQEQALPLPESGSALPNPPVAGPAGPPSNEEIFGTPSPDEPGSSDFFSSLAEFTLEPEHRADAASGEATGPAQRSWRRGTGAGSSEHVPAPFHNLRLHAADLLRESTHLSRVQMILLAGIIAIAAAVLYVLAARTAPPLPADRTPTGAAAATPEPAPRAPPRAQQAASPPRASVAAGSGTPAPSPVWEPAAAPTEPSLPTPEPLSLQLADKLYGHRDYEPARAMYEQLRDRLPATPENQPIHDFLLLRMALCSKNSGHVTQSDALLRTVSLSRLPILRALARYHQSTMLVGRKRYLEAAAKAYQTAALIEVASHDPKWVAAVQQQCRFLVAETVTRNVLSLCDADANLPPELWSEHTDIDPFVEMEEPQLRVFLTAGVQLLEDAVLSPQIRRVSEDATPRWSVLCNGASIEELLARFAANAKLNIHWTDGGQAPSLEDNVRARPVCLYLTSATTQQVVTMAAGTVGLVAQMDDKGAVRLLDPASYSSLADHTRLLADVAVVLWQRFLLAVADDARATNAHFAMGWLQAACGRFDEAAAAYKLVANRFAKHALAPQALLQSGMLKVRLRDYTGAHADLKQLVELYPETELSDQACLYLANASMKAGLFAEATGLYRKVHNLGLSLDSQLESALGAGRCFYETKDYEEAAQWLSRYVALVRDQNRPGFSAACLLLGKTYLLLHQPQQAQVALNLALKGELSHQQHVETTAELTRTFLERGLFLEALNTLENTTGWQLSQQEAVELVLLRAQTLRAIGLADKAARLLEEKSRYLPNPELQGRVALELARCQIQSDDLESGRTTLSQAFTTVESGPLAEEVGRELAAVCLRLGQTAQAASVCTQLLARASGSARAPILELLTDAYRKQGRYAQAVAAFLDRYEATADPNTAPFVRNN
ncbi:MAG: tetratricopeptide repeat protein [Planctomycetes bacterium]|jgi:tetratricopeptide (TPR) repeat protein|nr:tetratricopeptide repeat protein [Planctomycetota bacterium]